MPVKDEVWVIDDESILTVQDGKKSRGRKSGSPRSGSHRPSPEGEPAIYVGRGVAGPGSARPLVAATLSLLVCGAGQAYNGQRKLGTLFFLIEAMAVTFHWSATAMWGFLQEMGYLFEFTEEAMLLSVAGIDVFLALFILANVAQAWSHGTAISGGFYGFGKPVVSAFASALVPGCGQLCNAQLGKAMGFFACLVGAGLAATGLLLQPFGQYLDRINLIGRLSPQATQIAAGAIFLAAIVWAFSVYDAMIVARYRSRGR